MQITLRPEITDKLQKNSRQELEDYVNAVLLVYLTGGFIRSSDVESSFTLDSKDIYRKLHPEVIEVFDQMTNDCAGIAIVGYSESETVWIKNADLAKCIEENTELLVMKKPRKSGIRTIQGVTLHIDEELKNNKN